VRIPCGLAEDVGWAAGTEVSPIANDGELVLRSSLPSRLSASDLLAGITPENIHALIDTGDAIGTEAFGSEQRGRKPALVLSPKTYNGNVGPALFCPVASKVNGYPFVVKLPDGSLVTGVVLSDPSRGARTAAMDHCSDGRAWLPRVAEGEPVSHKETVDRRPLAGSAQGRDPGW